VRPCAALLVLVAIGLQAFPVLVFGHFRAALFLNGTHVLSPGMAALSDRLEQVCGFCSKDDFVKGQFNDTGCSGSTEWRNNIANHFFFNDRLNCKPTVVVQFVDGRRM